MFIRFGAEYDAGRHLISGWSNPEERIVWSNDRKSVLRFDSPKFRGDWSLALTVLTFSPPCQPYQAVTISINGFVIAEQIFRGPEASIELLVRAGVLEHHSEVEIQFQHHTPLRPADVSNSTDDRLLSIALIEMQMKCLHDYDLQTRSMDNMLYADAAVGVALQHERLGDTRNVNRELNRSDSPAGRSSFLIESYIRGLGATHHIRPRVRDAIVQKLKVERPELQALRPFDDEGAINERVVEAVVPALTQFIFRSASLDDVQIEEILPASSNEAAQSGVKLPPSAGIYHPDRPAFSILSNGLANAFVHPFYTVIYNKENHCAWRGTNIHDLSKLILSEPQVGILGNVVIVSDRFNGSNLAHFLFDSITRLYYFCLAKPELVSDSQYIFGGWPTPYHKLILSVAVEQLGLKESAIVFPRKGFSLRPTGRVFWFSDQGMYLHPAQRMHRTSIEILKGIGARLSIERTSTGRIYISRSDAELRRLENEEEIVRYLSDRSFRVVRLSEYSALEQIRLISNATCIVAPHGMGLTHLAFHQGQPTVIELFHPTVFSDDYALLSITYGFKYYSIIGTETDRAKSDYMVSLSDVANIVEKIDCEI